MFIFLISNNEKGAYSCFYYCDKRRQVTMTCTYQLSRDDTSKVALEQATRCSSKWTRAYYITSDGFKSINSNHTQVCAKAGSGISLQNVLSRDRYVNLKHTKYTLQYKINCEGDGTSAFLEQIRIQWRHL